MFISVFMTWTLFNINQIHSAPPQPPSVSERVDPAFRPSPMPKGKEHRFKFSSGRSPFQTKKLQLTLQGEKNLIVLEFFEGQSPISLGRGAERDGVIFFSWESGGEYALSTLRLYHILHSGKVRIESLRDLPQTENQIKEATSIEGKPKMILQKYRFKNLSGFDSKYEVKFKKLKRDLYKVAIYSYDALAYIGVALRYKNWITTSKVQPMHVRNGVGMIKWKKRRGTSKLSMRWVNYQGRSGRALFEEVINE